MDQILVTGATGFIGTHVCSLLSEKGYGVLGVVHKRQFSFSRPNLTSLDIDNLGSGKELTDVLKNVSCVIHCAGQAGLPRKSDASPNVELVSANVDFAMRMAYCAVNAGVKRFIFLSSIKVNGEQTSISKPFTSLDEENPSSAYAVSKLHAELELRKIAENTKLELVIIRPPLVYGVGAAGNVKLIIKALRLRLPLPLAGINNKRSIIAVENLADVILRCIDHPSVAGKIILVADENACSTTDFVEEIAAKMGVRAVLFYLPAPILIAAGKLINREQEVVSLLKSLVLDCSETKNLLGWTPPLESSEGLERMITVK